MFVDAHMLYAVLFTVCVKLCGRLCLGIGSCVRIYKVSVCMHLHVNLYI